MPRPRRGPSARRGPRPTRSAPRRAAGGRSAPCALAVEVAVEVEQVGLEQRGVGLGVERGPASERDGGGVDRSRRPLVPARVDAVGRQQDVAGHGDVGGREAELAAPAVALARRRRAPRAAGPAGRPPPPPRPRSAACGWRSTTPARRGPSTSTRPKRHDVEAVLGAQLAAAGRRCRRGRGRSGSPRPPRPRAPRGTRPAPRSRSPRPARPPAPRRSGSRRSSRRRWPPAARALVEVGEQLRRGARAARPSPDDGRT